LKRQKLKITKDDTENLLKDKTSELNLLRESFERSKKDSEDLISEKDERLGRITKELEEKTSSLRDFFNDKKIHEIFESLSHFLEEEKKKSFNKSYQESLMVPDSSGNTEITQFLEDDSEKAKESLEISVSALNKFEFLSQENERLNQETEKLSRELEKANKSVEALNQETERLTKDLENSNKENKRLEQSLEVAKQSIINLSKNPSSSRSKEEAKTNVDTSGEINPFEDIKKNAIEMNAKLKSMKEKDEANKKKIKSIEKKLKKYGSTIEEKDKKIQKTKEEMQDRLEKIVTGKSTEIIKLQEDLKKKEEELTSANILMKDMKDRLKATITELRDIQKLNDELQQKEDHSAIVLQLNNRILQVQEDKKKLVDENKKLEEQIVQLQEGKKKLEDENRRLEEAKELCNNNMLRSCQILKKQKLRIEELVKQLQNNQL